MSILKIGLDSEEILELNGEYSINMEKFYLSEPISFKKDMNGKTLIHIFNSVIIDSNGTVFTNDENYYKLGKFIN